MDRKKGFSLVELVIVLAIMGILSVVVIPNFNKFKEEAKSVAKKADIKILMDAARLAMTSGDLEESEDFNLFNMDSLDSDEIEKYAKNNKELLESKLVPEYLDHIPDFNNKKTKTIYDLNTDSGKGNAIADALASMLNSNKATLSFDYSDNHFFSYNGKSTYLISDYIPGLKDEIVKQAGLSKFPDPSTTDKNYYLYRSTSETGLVIIKIKSPSAWESLSGIRQVDGKWYRAEYNSSSGWSI
ncbi:hypothetical protein SH2C18_28110 [Clostridium sediminicola]|uniref:type II secretion system protein n=1 Tax=Clostridium sediminicola TaxID=3114879 RepID=UPI0031F21D7C